MPKFTLIGEHTDLQGNPDGTKVIYEFHVDHLDDVLQHADLFIRGCGYNPTGTLDYISDEEFYGEPTMEEWDRADNYEHSGYYFDYDRNRSVNHEKECGK